ncbi:PAS domain-containing protein [Lewinella sp. JB7]|uniref:PAS domain-containing protein n=1 Tax=Lewinella sp. JB7 TaxID=2962887 RepID=UPI0020C9784C|nr:PAS domain-containing protein [Lewinella sp. JB7]MCP9237167.1 PAS domain-containing protein [Lewinella sp. JB7]
MIWKNFDITGLYKSQGFRGAVLFSVLVLAYIAGNHAQPMYKTYLDNEAASQAQQRTDCYWVNAQLRQDYDKLAAKYDLVISEMKVMQQEIADLTAEIRMNRRADDQSKVKRWELDKDLKVYWFNPAFRRGVWQPAGINPFETYGKTWHELLPKEVADNARRTDLGVKRTLQPISYDDGVTIEKRADGTYRVWWRVIKEPLIDDYGEFQGIRGEAHNYREEKIE